MQIVIDIPEEVKHKVYAYGLSLCSSDKEQLINAIMNGTPLPKGHWIHRTQDGGCFWEECSVCHTERAFPTKYCPDCGTYMYADIRTDAPTIIEADEAERTEV